MMRKLFATSCLAGMVIIGAVVLANAAPNPGESGPSLPSSQTTPTTPTTPATNAPYPGHVGY
jgi:heme-binding NEAT domain protein